MGDVVDESEDCLFANIMPTKTTFQMKQENFESNCLALLK